MKIQFRAFSLLEILIVLALLVITFPILISPLFNAQKNTILEINAEKLDVLASYVFANYLIDMKKNPSGFTSLGEVTTEPIQSNWIPTGYEGEYTLNKKGQEQATDEEDQKVQLWNITFILKLPLDKKPSKYSFDFITLKQTESPQIEEIQTPETSPL